MASDLSVALHRLHALLIQLGDAERSLAHGPKRIAAAEKNLKAGQEAVDLQKQQIKASRKTADEGNLKLRTREADLLKLQGVLNQASSNKEYDIVKGQIASGNTEQARLEEAALAAMDEVDTSQQKLAQLEASLKVLEQQFQQMKSQIATAEPELRAQVDSFRAQVEEAEKGISWGDKAAAYLRLRGAHGASALAAIEDLCCTSCSNRVTTQDIVRINTGNLMSCRECGRIVYVV